MKTAQALFLSVFFWQTTAFSQVPSLINYSGRLLESDGRPVNGVVNVTVDIFDSQTDGSKIYAETIGGVVVNQGVYSFKFGEVGTGIGNKSELLTTTDGTANIFVTSLSADPIENSLIISDGTYTWNAVVGNTERRATATPTIVNGFMVGVLVEDGGSGYVNPPLVTITGNGVGAIATAVVTNGAVSSINISNPGSGYTSALVEVAPPPVPFGVSASLRNITVTYNEAPVSGNNIIASYKSHVSGIASILLNTGDFWMEVGIDGQAQTPRQRLLAVPFSLKSSTAEVSFDAEKLGGQSPAFWIPSGAMMAFGGSDDPPGWLICDGRQLNKNEYPNLFAAIGYTYSSVQSGELFNIPNTQGVVLRGTGSITINSRVKSGPNLGAYQEDQMQRLTGQFAVNRNNSSTSVGAKSGTGAVITGGTLGDFSTGFVRDSSSSTGTKVQFDSFSSPDARVTESTSGETRVTSLGVNYIIKY